MQPDQDKQPIKLESTRQRNQLKRKLTLLSTHKTNTRILLKRLKQRVSRHADWIDDNYNFNQAGWIVPPLMGDRLPHQDQVTDYHIKTRWQATTSRPGDRLPHQDQVTGYHIKPAPKNNLYIYGDRFLLYFWRTGNRWPQSFESDQNFFFSMFVLHYCKTLVKYS